MKILKRLLVPILLAAQLLCLISCGADGFRVPVLVLGEGDVVVEDGHRSVPFGQHASFDVTLPAGQSIIQVLRDDHPITEGYHYENGVLTVYDVKTPQTITVVSGDPNTQTYWGVDPNTKYGGYIASSVGQGRVTKGTLITMVAIPNDGAEFLGWTLRRPMKSGGEVLGTDEQLTIEITDNTFLYANFNADNVPRPEPVIHEKPKTASTLTVFYNINGGDTLADNKVAIETTFDTSYWKMPYGREDDGRIKREGYVLLGYSTDPDAKDGLILPGHKYMAELDGDMQMMLYAIWQKASDKSNFTYEKLNETSLKITGYKGNDEILYIPRAIDGILVKQIASGAFAGAKMKEVTIPSGVETVEAGAFSDCANLTKVVAYDTLKNVTDKSFTGSPVKTLRLLAGGSPKYVNSSQAFGKKYERLMMTEGDKRIIIIAGSSKFYGIDTDYMETLFEDDYTVVNFGTNANMSILFFLDAITPYFTEDDVVVYAPEQYGPYAYYTNGNPGLPAVTLQGISNCYNILENIDVSKYTGVFDSLGQYARDCAKMSALSWDAYSKTIDIYGDHGTLTAQLNSPNYRNNANGDFRFNETVIPAEFIPNLNRVLDGASDTGATVLFSYPPHNKNNVLPDSLDEESYDFYNNWIAETVNCQLISDVRNYIIEGIYFSNTDYHLNAVGRTMHTKQLAEDIIAANVGVK